MLESLLKKPIVIKDVSLSNILIEITETGEVFSLEDYLGLKITEKLLTLLRGEKDG